MKKIVFLLSFLIIPVVLALAARTTYGPTTLDYETRTEANSAGVASVVVMWDKNKAKDINIVGSVTVGGQTKSFSTSGSNGQCIITFRNLVPDRHYSVEWEFIDPKNFPN